MYFYFNVHFISPFVLFWTFSYILMCLMFSSPIFFPFSYLSHCILIVFYTFNGPWGILALLAKRFYFLNIEINYAIQADICHVGRWLRWGMRIYVYVQRGAWHVPGNCSSGFKQEIDQEEYNVKLLWRYVPFCHQSWRHIFKNMNDILRRKISVSTPSHISQYS